MKSPQPISSVASTTSGHSRTFPRLRLLFETGRRTALVLGLLLSGCAGQSAEHGELLVDIDKRNTDRLMRLYAGAIDGARGDSLLRFAGNDIYISDAEISRRTGDGADADGDGALSWSELKSLVARTYNLDGRLPATRAALESSTQYRANNRSLRVELLGTMTTAERRIYVPLESIRHALRKADPSDPVIIYPAGTTIVGEHWGTNQLLETTVMSKRTDGMWDFYVYGTDGQLSDSTKTEPKPLASPVQCAGCHFGTREFEPEKSFPDPARPGPDGPREFLSPTAGVDAALVDLLNEHGRRSDSVLGVYATIFLGQLRSTVDSDALSDGDRKLLNKFMGEDG